MATTSTPIDKQVLDFYKQLPFNYKGTVETHALGVVERKSYGEKLEPLLKKGTKVLEVGCGAGWFANGIAYHYKCDVKAFDFNPVVIERAKEVRDYLGLSVDYFVEDVFDYEPKELADVVVSIGVLHHTLDPLNAVKYCSEFIKEGGHMYLGLYHEYGRRPFLNHFKKLQKDGLSEDELFAEYCKLDKRISDKTQLKSWFRDQVLHPHENQYTLEEMKDLLSTLDMTLEYSSIEGDEKKYTDIAEQKLQDGSYYPGFFNILARKN